jgi:hypothetical protein
MGLNQERSDAAHVLAYQREAREPKMILHFRFELTGAFAHLS